MIINIEQLQFYLKHNDLKQIKQIIDESNINQFKQKEAIEQILTNRSEFITKAIQFFWDKFNIDNSLFALIATGGFGRNSLHLFSDIDFLIIKNTNDEQELSKINAFLQALWDAKFILGASIRNNKEIIEDIKNDLSFLTSLLDTRFLSGNKNLFLELEINLSRENCFNKEFINKKKLEKEERYLKFGNTNYNLEPNIKNSPGNLRDVQYIFWLAKSMFANTESDILAKHKFLTLNEQEQLNEATNFLETTRFALHLISNKANENLIFDLQFEVAKLLNFTKYTNQQIDKKATIENFMQQYYKATFCVSYFVELTEQFCLQFFLKRINKIEYDEAFYILNNEIISIKNETIFAQKPQTLLKIFYIYATNQKIASISFEAMRLIKKYANQIDEKFRLNHKNQHIFLDILKSEFAVHKTLRKMHKYKVLENFLPSFKHINAMMQHDLFHIYTVDEHTLNVVKNLRKFYWSSKEKEFSLSHKLIKNIRASYLLYLVALFHDVGKGTGFNHAKIGAKEIAIFSKICRLDKQDTDLLIFLVKEHILMSEIAQKKDIDDAQIIYEFAQIVQTKEKLDYLYLLTVADINATNPKLWNSYRASLLERLHFRTNAMLANQITDIQDRREIIAENKIALTKVLQNDNYQSQQITNLINQIGDDYFYRYQLPDILWQTKAILDKKIEEPLILIRNSSQNIYSSWTEIFIYTQEKQAIFARIAAILSSLNLNIHNAKVLTTTNNYILNSYVVLEKDGLPIEKETRKLEIFNTLQRKIQETNKIVAPTFRLSQKMQHFKFQPEINFIQKNKQQTIIEIIALDKPGLLTTIALIFNEFEIIIEAAKITTQGEKALDIFYISDKHKQALSKKTIQELKIKLIEQIQ